MFEKCYIETMEYSSTLKKRKILPFVRTRLILEDIMLSKNKSEDKYSMISLI